MTEIVGVIPAAGRASRISPLPCSKELYPIGLRLSLGQTGRPKVVSQHLLDSMRSAGAKKAFVVLREGKWDIPTYYNDGTALVDIHIAYLMMRVPFGVPFTIDQAYPFVRDSLVLFGFPDIVFEPKDAFVELLKRQSRTKAEAVLGAWDIRVPVDDRLVLDGTGQVRRVDVGSSRTDLPLTWNMAVWTPAFTEFIHTYVASMSGQIGVGGDASLGNIVVGNVIAAAVDAGLRVDAVHFSTGSYLDIGTPESLAMIHARDRPELLT
jgi:glucose-1-phosphate thymidylyltransferase